MPLPVTLLLIHHGDTGRQSDGPRSCQLQSSRAEDCMGYLTPLGLGGCRPVALMATTQPAGPRSWADAGPSLAPVLQDATG